MKGNRDELTILSRRVGYDNSIALADNTPRVTFMRRAVQTELSPKNLPRFQPLQATETNLMLGKLLETPDDFMEHIRM